MPYRRTKNAVLRCRISRGIFTNEFFVVIEVPGGETFTTVADKSQVVFQGNRPDEIDSVEAGVKVSVLGEQSGMLLIDLPRETFSQGNRILVPPEMLKRQAAL